MAGRTPKSADKPEESAGSLFVTAPLVSAKTKAGTVVHLRRGDVITDVISAESIELLTGLDFLSETSPLDNQ